MRTVKQNGQLCRDAALGAEMIVSKPGTQTRTPPSDTQQYSSSPHPRQALSGRHFANPRPALTMPLPAHRLPSTRPRHPGRRAAPLAAIAPRAKAWPPALPDSALAPAAVRAVRPAHAPPACVLAQALPARRIDPFLCARDRADGKPSAPRTRAQACISSQGQGAADGGGLPPRLSSHTGAPDGARDVAPPHSPFNKDT